jgi:hypothetical protein
MSIRSFILSFLALTSVSNPATGNEFVTLQHDWSPLVGASTQGLVGQAFLSPDGNVDFEETVRSGFALGTPVLLSQLNFPQHSTPGLVRRDGSPLLIQGQPIRNSFGLRLETQLRAPTEAAWGDYQLAVTADDWARVKIDGRTLIEITDPVTHNRFRAAEESISISHSHPVRLELDYFQAGGYISLTLYWRRLSVGGTESLTSELNRSWGESFAPNRAAHLAILEEGWQVVPPEAFVLPNHRSIDRQPTPSVMQTSLPHLVSGPGNRIASMHLRPNQRNCIPGQPGRIALEPCDSSNGAQLWRFRYRGAREGLALVSIVNPSNDLCLTVRPGNGTNATAESCADLDTQDFLVVPLSEGRFEIKTAPDPGFCLDIAVPNPRRDGFQTPRLQAWTCNVRAYRLNQFWQFLR